MFAAEIDELEVGALVGELCLPSHRSGCDRCATGEVRETVTDQGVSWVTALGHRRDHETVRG